MRTVVGTEVSFFSYLRLITTRFLTFFKKNSLEHWRKFLTVHLNRTKEELRINT